jgi:hypothetical protein
MKYNIVDIVKVNLDGAQRWPVAVFVGDTGTIVDRSLNRDPDRVYGVRMDRRDFHFHDLDGKLEDYTGYWLGEYAIDLVSRKYEVLT